jgi:hypothetical protein
MHLGLVLWIVVGVLGFALYSKTTTINGRSSLSGPSVRVSCASKTPADSCRRVMPIARSCRVDAVNDA